MTVYEIKDLVGTSATSVSDAIRGAVERAGASHDRLLWFEVKEVRGRVDTSNAPEFQVRVDIGVEKTVTPAEAKSSKSKRSTTTRQTRSAEAQVAAKKGEKKKAGLARDFEAQGR